MTTFCFVHGAWHDDACWAPLISALQARGHECITPVLPLEELDAGFEDYANVVIDSLIGRHRPVLVGHSMSSAVIRLVALERPVALLVYLCPAMAGFPAPADEPPYQRPGFSRPPVDADDRMYWPREQAITQLYARAGSTNPPTRSSDTAIRHSQHRDPHAPRVAAGRRP
jgi:pimeloyl-ACP methyl ester carboxylesterase